MRVVSAAVGGVLLVLLVAAVTLRSQAASSESFERAAAGVRALRESDARLILLVTRSRFQVSRTYDPLVAAEQRVADGERALDPGGAAAYGAGQSAVDAARTAVHAAFDQQREWLEEFKSENAILKNAVGYLPLAADAVAGSTPGAPACPEAARLAQQLAARVLAHDISPRPGTEAAVAESVSGLENERDRCLEALRPAIESVLAQARTAMASRSSVDEAVARLTAAPTGPRLEALAVAHQQRRDGELRSADGYRLALGGISGALSLAILLAVVRLIRGARALAAANTQIARSAALLRATLAQLLEAEKLAVAGRLALDVAPEIEHRVALAREAVASARAAHGAAADARLEVCEVGLRGLAALTAARLREHADGSTGEPTVEARARLVDVVDRCADTARHSVEGGVPREVTRSIPHGLLVGVDAGELEIAVGSVLAFLESAGANDASRGPVNVEAVLRDETCTLCVTDPELTLTPDVRGALREPDPSASPAEVSRVAEIHRRGLAVAQCIARRWGGEIALEPAAGGGTSFVLRQLPRASA